MIHHPSDQKMAAWPRRHRESDADFEERSAGVARQKFAAAIRDVEQQAEAAGQARPVTAIRWTHPTAYRVHASTAANRDWWAIKDQAVQHRDVTLSCPHAGREVVETIDPSEPMFTDVSYRCVVCDEHYKREMVR
jgi:hypothetical protein